MARKPVAESPSLGSLRELVRSAVSIALAGGANPAAVAGILTELSAWSEDQPWEPATASSLSVVHATTRLTQIWSSEAEYLDDRGVPLPLPISGRKHSFTRLAKAAGGFKNTREALDLLQRYGTVTFDGANVTLLSRAVIPHWTSPEARARAWALSAGHLDTLARNLSDRPKSEKRVERAAHSANFPVSARQSFRDVVQAQADAFLVLTDQLMKTYEERAATRGEPTESIAITITEIDMPSASQPLKRRMPVKAKRVTKARR